MSNSERRFLGGITLNVLFLGVTSFLTDVSSEMIFALLPFFMVDVLGIQMVVVGFIEGLAETTAGLLRVFSGWLSDKLRRRKPFAVVGYSLSALSKPLFALASSSLHILAVRVLDRFGKGIRTSPRDALIADSVDADVRGKAYGFHRSMDTLGAVVGPLLAFLLFPLIWYRGVFLASIIPGVVAVLVLAALVREQPQGAPRSKKASPPWRKQSSLSREFKIFIVVTAIFTLGSFSYAFFLLRAQSLGIQKSYAPLLYLLFNAVYAVFAYPVGLLADRVGKKNVILTGYLIFSVTCYGFAFATLPLHAVALFVAYGMFHGTLNAVQRAIIPDVVAPELRGTAFGILHATTAIIALPSSFVAGVLWQYHGASASFIMSGTLSLLAAVLFATLVSKNPAKTKGCRSTIKA